MVLPPNNANGGAPAGAATAQPIPTATPPKQAANPQPAAAAAGLDPNSGAARMTSSKVAPHITPLGSTPPRPQATASQSQQQAAQNAYQPNGGQQRFWQNGQQPRQQQRANPNPNQFKVNDKLVMDFSLLDNAMGYKTTFASTKLGQFLTNFSKEMQLQLNVNWNPEVAAYVIDIGNAHIMWVTGMANMNSPAYTIPQRIMNPQAFANQGSRITHFLMQYFYPNQNANPDDGYAVFFDDDLEYNFQAVCFFISKLIAPNEPMTKHITEDQYLNQRLSGFHVIDTRAIKNGGNVNQAYYSEVKNSLKMFFDLNSPSAMKVAGDEIIALAATDHSNQWNAYNNGWGGGWQNGGMGFGNAFGQNGGFGIGGYQQPREKILGAVRYYVTQESNPNFPNGGKYNIAHLTEICEPLNVVVENFLKYVLLHLKSCGYAIQLELDLSKVTQNMKKNLLQLFVPANSYGGFGGYGASNFSALTAYVKRDGNKLVRIAPSFLTLRVFKSIHPEYDKDPKFPKDLTKYESQVYFEECKRKEGYIQMLNAGAMRLVFNDNYSQQLLHDYNGHLYAINQNMTFDEMLALQQNGQQPNQNPQQGWQQNTWQNNGWGGGFGQPGWGGPQPQYAFGGYPNYGQNGAPNGWQPNGGWGPMNGMGMGYPNNGMMGGYPPMGPMGYQQPPMMGQQPYPVNQGQPQNGKKGQPTAQPFYPNNGMMGGYPPMGGGMYPNGGMMGGPMGYPMYQPGMVAGGAFPPPNNGGAGGYIPN